MTPSTKVFLPFVSGFERLSEQTFITAHGVHEHFSLADTRAGGTCPQRQSSFVMTTTGLAKVEGL
jgi:hypothetical protein